MSKKTFSRSANRLFSFVLLVSLSYLMIGGEGVLTVQASKTGNGSFASQSMRWIDENDFVINPGNYQIPESLLTALIAKLGELGEKAGGATSFGVGYYEEHRNWAWINLLAANGSYFDNEAIGPTFLYFGIRNGNAWNIVLAENNREYLSLLDTVSKAALDLQETALLDHYYDLNQTGTRITATAGGLLFPWSNSQNPWRFSSNGFHAAGFPSLGAEAGAEAIDLIPPSSAQPAKVLAMESGTVVNKLECTWNTVLIVHHDGYPDTKRFVYLHIQNGTSTVGIGAHINRGQYLGELRTPVFNGYGSNEACSEQGTGSFTCERDVNPTTGNLCSSSNTRHLHLGFGTDRNIEVDGNVIANLVPGNPYNSTNQENDNGGAITDEFNNPTLDPHWHWVREDPTHWSLSATPGYLQMVTQRKDIWQSNNNAPLLLQSSQSLSTNDFEIQTRIVITPTANFHQGGLVVYGDDDNYVRLTYAYLDGPMFEFAKEIGGAFQPIQIPAPSAINDFHLRIVKSGLDYSAYYSEDGTNWTGIGTHFNVNISPLEVGLLAFNAVAVTSVEIPANFDYFRLTPKLPNRGADTTGVFRPMNGLLYLKNKNETGFADIALNYGIPGDYPVVGDWDGDGTVTIGIYRNGSFYLRNSNTVGFADAVFAFGQVGDQPIAGDWDGDGKDTIGVYRTSTGQFLLRNSNSAGLADYSFYLGNVGDVGIAGDWDGDGKDTTGVFRPTNGIIFLKNSNTTGYADIALNYGIPGDKPVVGDWNNDGIDTIGVYRNGQFMLRDSNTVGFADYVFGLGNPGDMPIAGNWDGVP